VGWSRSPTQEALAGPLSGGHPIGDLPFFLSVPFSGSTLGYGGKGEREGCGSGTKSAPLAAGLRAESPALSKGIT
jgi:hypothetical protein